MLANQLRHFADEGTGNPTRALKFALGLNDRATYRAVFRRLAEAIHRPTCKNVNDIEYSNFEYFDFACGDCGYCCDLPEPNFCPNCGAEVVE